MKLLNQVFLLRLRSNLNKPVCRFIILDNNRPKQLSMNKFKTKNRAKTRKKARMNSRTKARASLSSRLKLKIAKNNNQQTNLKPRLLLLKNRRRK